MTIFSFNDADGRTVIDGSSAETIGAIEHFAVDIAGTQIEAIHISGKRKKAELLPWAGIQSFGADAVVAIDGDQASTADDDRLAAAARGKLAVRGSRVLSTDGFDLGTITDAHFDADTGRLVDLVIGDDTVAAERVRSFGSYAVVVSAEN